MVVTVERVDGAEEHAFVLTRRYRILDLLRVDRGVHDRDRARRPLATVASLEVLGPLIGNRVRSLLAAGRTADVGRDGVPSALQLLELFLGGSRAYPAGDDVDELRRPFAD